MIRRVSMKQFIFVLCLSSLLFPAAYYISPSGANGTSRNGSEAQPWRSIDYALARVQSGDTVWAEDGHYPSLYKYSGPPRAFTKYTYVIARNTRMAYIDDSSGQCVGFFNDNCDYIALDGFVMDAQNGTVDENVCHLGGGSYYIVRNCTMTHGVGGAQNEDALKINGTDLHHILIEGNIIFDGTDEGMDILASTNSAANKTHDIVIRRNLFYETPNLPVDEAMASCKYLSRRIIFDGNVFGRMVTGSNNGALRFGGDPNPGTEPQALIAINNAFVNTYGRRGAFALMGSKYTLFANNVVYNHGGTWCLVGISSNGVATVESAYFTIVNNIFYSTAVAFPPAVYSVTNLNASAVHDYRIDYNLYYNGGSAIPTGGLNNPNSEPHKVIGKPLFGNGGAAITGNDAYDWINQLKILAGSPSMDKGVRLEDLNLQPAVDSLLQDYFYAKYDPWYELVKTNGYRDAFGTLHGASSAMDIGLYSSDTPEELLPGVRNDAGNPAIYISPNPVVRTAFITFFNLPANVDFSIYNISGKLVSRAGNVDTRKEFIWNAGTLADGVYVLQVRNGGRIYSKKLMLQR